ncbi:hypothetical protein V490_03975, partial [Pseudogymnoascus sp. VKM F-3557]
MTSRAYFYHLRFELFPKPPTTFVDATAPDIDDETRLPSTPVSFSDSLPNLFKPATATAAEDKHRLRATTKQPAHESTRRTTTDAPNTLTSQRRGSVIDCGPQRVDIHRDSPPRDEGAAPI